NLHRRQREMLGDLGVADLLRLVQGLALDPLGRERAGGDGRAAAEGLELRVLDNAVGTDPDLQLHHVATGGRADETRPQRGIVLVQRPDIAGVVVMVQQLVAIAHRTTPYSFAAASLPQFLCASLALNAPPI